MAILEYKVSWDYDPLLGAWVRHYFSTVILVITALAFVFIHRQLAAQLTRSHFFTSHEWQVHIVVSSVLASVHAVIICCAGIRIINECEDFIEDRLEITPIFVMIKCGFLVYDLWASQRILRRQHGHAASDLVTLQCIVIVEHVVLPIVCVILFEHTRSQIGDFYVGYFFLTEAVTPFVSVRTLLEQFHMKDALMYATISRLVIVAIICFRFLLVPLMLWRYANYVDLPIWLAPIPLPFEVSFSALGMICYNLYRTFKPHHRSPSGLFWK